MKMDYHEILKKQSSNIEMSGYQGFAWGDKMKNKGYHGHIPRI